jgi:hypothetical protein
MEPSLGQSSNWAICGGYSEQSKDIIGGVFGWEETEAEGRGLIIGSPPEAASGRAQKKEYLRETKIFKKSYLQIVS